MNIEALKQLRRVVKEAPEDRFHMRTWSEKAPCGTAYCAAGWAVTDPWFRKNTAIGKIFRVTKDGDVRPKLDFPSSWLAKIFDISQGDSLVLFGSRLNIHLHDPHAVSKSEVIANIDRILAGQQPEEYAVLRKDGD